MALWPEVCGRLGSALRPAEVISLGQDFFDREVLRNGHACVDAVAVACGFDALEIIFHAYKRRFSVSPSCDRDWVRARHYQQDPRVWRRRTRAL